jgi:hypothetical protein
VGETGVTIYVFDTDQERLSKQYNLIEQLFSPAMEDDLVAKSQHERADSLLRTTLDYLKAVEDLK